MKKSLISLLVLAMSMFSLTVLSQTGGDSGKDTTLLNLPGDNLDLYAVLDLFQKSKTIEDFEKSLNEEKSGINNLDLNLDNKVDFIKVVTKQDGENFTFILQVDVAEKEVQDVAVILVSKDKDKKITMQIVGDKDLYGENYVIEPKAPAPAATPNPGYVSAEPVAAAAAAPAATPAAAAAPSTTTVVVVEQAPIVQYVYSPVYVPYYPPYYYAYYPPYFVPFTVVAISVYSHNNYYHHHGYYGGHGNTTVVVHNTNNYNNYNKSRNTSNTVNHYNSNGNYNANKPTNTSNRGTSAAPTNQSRSASPSTSQSKGTSASPSTSQSKGTSASPTTQSRGASASPSTSQSKGASASPSTSQGSRRSTHSGGGSRRR